jgi:hypothetical protein
MRELIKSLNEAENVGVSILSRIDLQHEQLLDVSKLGLFLDEFFEN